jgi:hypothetical protein
MILQYFSDLFETASTYNYTIEFSEKDFEIIVKNHYFLLKYKIFYYTI